MQLWAYEHNTGYSLAVHIYCMQDDRPIPDDVLEETILNVVMSFYDGASNGNRTRGGVRKASEMYVHILVKGYWFINIS